MVIVFACLSAPSCCPTWSSSGSGKAGAGRCAGYGVAPVEASQYLGLAKAHAGRCAAGGVAPAKALLQQ
eukprot:15152571-Alexandrium_andersonii.AAC.1